jgi:hypothetical protein
MPVSLVAMSVRGLTINEVISVVGDEAQSGGAVHGVVRGPFPDLIAVIIEQGDDVSRSVENKSGHRSSPGVALRT